MYTGRFLFISFVAYKSKNILLDTSLRRKAVFVTLEINGNYFSFNIYETLKEYFPKITKKLIYRLEKGFQYETFILNDSLQISNLETILRKYQQ